MSGQQTSDIPLPLGTPPPPIFGSVQQPVTFADLARKGQDVMTSTLQQYGPAMPSMNHHVHHQNQGFQLLHHQNLPHTPHIQNHHQQQPQHQQQHLMPTHYNIQTPQLVPHHQPQQQPALIHMQSNPHQHYHQNQRQDTNLIYHQVATGPPIVTNQIQAPIFDLGPIGQSNQVTNSRPHSAGPNTLHSTTTTANPSNRTVVSNIPVSQPVLSKTPTILHQTATNSISPPLDSFNQKITKDKPESSSSSSLNSRVINNVCQPTSSTNSIEIPEEPVPPKKEIMKFVRERCEKLNLNQLIEEYSLVEKDMNEARQNREKAEKNLNDYMRLARGQNVEHQPKFIKLKEEEQRNLEECRDFDEALKYVRDKLDSKFNYKIGQSTRVIQPLQGKRQVKQTVRMRTTPAPTRPNKQPSHPELTAKEEESVIFDLKDSNLWCKDCDIHFQSIKEFFEHLHKREHLSQYIKPAQPPWRTGGNQLNRKKSFDLYKSICAKVTNKLQKPFTISDLDEIINPSLKSQPSKVKQIMLKRERGEFSSNDHLFNFKGYDMLLPISGYYCKLCDRTLCDKEEAERHLKSFQHNSEFSKTVALNPTHEKRFRQALEKSYKDQFGSELRRSSAEHSPNKKKDIDKPKPSTSLGSGSTAAAAISNGPSPTPPIASSSSNHQSSSKQASISVPLQWSARTPYKKPTSKIVDEHDVIADRFEKRDGPKDIGASNSKGPENPPSARSTIITPDITNVAKENNKSEKPKLDKRKEPEIVPLKNQSSASLKRLRTDGIKKAPEPPSNQVHEHADDNVVDIRSVLSQLGSSSEDEEVTRKRVEKKKRPKSNAYVDDDSDTVDQDPDNSTIAQCHLDKGDKDSPFPDLYLSVGKNVHSDALKDPRLAKPLRVKLNRIDLNLYKDMLLEETNLWSRVEFMMAKKEPDEYEKDLNSATATEPSYFNTHGESVPINFDSSDDEKTPFQMNMLETFFCENK